MQTIYRESVYLDEDDNEVLLCSANTECKDMRSAILSLEEFYKTDRAMYRLAIKQRPNVYCDNWRYETSYGFCVNDVTIRAYIVDAEKTALETFRL
jgi:hypothetical protein